MDVGLDDVSRRPAELEVEVDAVVVADDGLERAAGRRQHGGDLDEARESGEEELVELERGAREADAEHESESDDCMAFHADPSFGVARIGVAWIRPGASLEARSRGAEPSVSLRADTHSRRL
jgi:hypothetical protein